MDDEPFVAHALQIFLGDEHDVRVMTDAREALAHLRTSADYDAVLCDIMMPVVTGIDLHRAIAATNPELAGRFVFITGGILDARMGDYLEGIANPCIDKPPNPFELRQMMRVRVAEVIGLQQAANARP